MTHQTGYQYWNYPYADVYFRSYKPSWPPSCGHILQADPSATTGVYTIDPVGGDPFSVYCDMTTDGGGWELITARETNVLSSTTGSVVMPTSKGYAVTDARLLHDHGKYFPYFQECNHLF